MASPRGFFCATPDGVTRLARDRLTVGRCLLDRRGATAHGALDGVDGADDRLSRPLDRVCDFVLGPRRHVRLVAEGVDRLAHLVPGLLYALPDFIWLLAHCTSSFTVSTVCSGIGGTASLTFSLPCRASPAAIAA